MNATVNITNLLAVAVKFKKILICKIMINRLDPPEDHFLPKLTLFMRKTKKEHQRSIEKALVQLPPMIFHLPTMRKR